MWGLNNYSYKYIFYIELYYLSWTFYFPWIHMKPDYINTEYEYKYKEF